jgi:hypothetical protein
MVDKATVILRGAGSLLNIKELQQEENMQHPVLASGGLRLPKRLFFTMHFKI